MTDSDMLYQLDISTFYFYEQLLFQIFNFWKFYKNLAFPLSTIFFTIYFHTFTVNSHVDKHSINIFICFKYDTVWNLSFIKIYIKVLLKIFSKFDLNLKCCSYFCNKNHGLQKKSLEKNAFFTADYVKIELHVVHTCRHMQSE